MDLGSLPLFKAMAKRMAWLGERQQVLAQNVANADTPGYIAHDLKPLSFRDLVGKGAARLPLAATDPSHLSGSSRGPSTAPLFAESGERTPSGNNVSLEKEMMRVSQTASDYALVTNLYRRQLALIKLALGREQP
jgi:flagellar basal-body rod protein FlgB